MPHMKLPFPPSALLPSLKPPLQMTLRLAPDRLLSTALAALFTHLLRGQSLADRLHALDRRGIAISITDPGCELRFRIIDGRVECDWDRSNLAGRDVRLRGRFEDFWLMATRVEDPDTLFFNRRLAIEGDTETGLTLKNLLDALDYDWRAHVAAVLGPFAASLLPSSTTSPVRRTPRSLL